MSVEGEVIRAAAGYIEKHGMAKHCLRTDDGRACMLGALGAVMPDFLQALSDQGVSGWEPARNLDGWMEANVGPSRAGLRPMAYWNDRPETSRASMRPSGAVALATRPSPISRTP